MSDCSKTVTNSEVIALLFAIAPQFKTEDPDILAGYNALLDSLRCLVNTKLLGCCAALALANLLAHYLTLQGNPFLGTEASLTEGQLSITKANTVNNFYQSTAYGQAYLQIIGRYKVGAYITNTGRGWRGPACCGFGPGFYGGYY